jgi:hypothetical protein
MYILYLMTFTSPTAYGEYNDEVREVAGQRGQTVVNWDFEYILFLTQRVRFLTNDSFSSSGDSVGASVAESNRRYDEVVSQHPSTLLALNHEVYGKCPFSLVSLHIYLADFSTETTA